MKENKYWIGLSRIEGLGPVYISSLIKYYKRPSVIWGLNKKHLMAVKGIGPKTAEKIINQRQQIDLSQTMSYLNKRKINYITLNEDDYPEKLKAIYDPPPVLFYQGQNLNNKMKCLAIVGSRRASSYGKKVAERLGYKLAQRGFVIVSGMARGIDGCSHIGALKAGGDTIAVMGSGLNYIYPPENRELCNNIKKNGIIMSEFYPDIEPCPGNFPRRNRIISGLSLGVIVVEAANRSGSLITAHQALEQGREVFAVPGNIDRIQSKGTNKLIQEGAKMVTDVDDIIEELFLYSQQESITEKVVYPKLTDEEEELIQLFQNEAELPVDKIIQQCSYSVDKVNCLLLKLELKGLIEKQPGKKYYFKGLQNLLKPI